MIHFLAQVKLDDVFKSTQRSMQSGGGSSGAGQFLILLFCAIGLIVVLVVLQQRRKREVVPVALNHLGKLLREVLKSLPLKSNEVKQLKQLAEEHSCRSPLTLLLCPSLLAKALHAKPAAERKTLATVARKITP